MKLSKLIVGAAWVDGNLVTSELNALKDLIFSFDELSEKDWKILDLYIDTPVNEKECMQLMDDLIREVRSEEDKQFILEKLSELVEADGKVTDEEKKLIETISDCLEKKKTGFLSLFKRISIIRNDRNISNRENREDRIDDYVKNKVFFDVVTRHSGSRVLEGVAEKELRRLCLISAMIAFVAKSDDEISDSEKARMIAILKKDYNLSSELAEIVCECSLSLADKQMDMFELTRNLYGSTDYTERVNLLEVLFDVANCCGKTSNEEINTIGKISDLLKVQRSDFIAAKLTISKEDRQGL